MPKCVVDGYAVDSSGWTPLHKAAFFGRGDICKFLLQHHCDINVKTNGGCTPLHWAAQQNKVDVVKLLGESGAHKTLRNRAGKMPIDLTTHKVIKDYLKSAKDVSPTKKTQPTLNVPPVSSPTSKAKRKERT